MSTKFTKGPWFVVEGGANGRWPRGCELVIDDAEGGNEERNYFLASAVHGDPDELLANARLIAKAPELYEVLRAIVKFDGASNPPGLAPRDWTEARCAADKTARALLAEIEGE